MLAKNLACLCQESCNEFAVLLTAWVGRCPSLGVTTRLYSPFCPKCLSPPTCARPCGRLALYDGSCIRQVGYVRTLELDGVLMGKQSVFLPVGLLW